MYARTLNLPTLSILLSALFWGLWWIPLRWVEGLGLSALLINTFLYGAGAIFLLPIAVKNFKSDTFQSAIVVSGITLGLTLITWNLALLQGEVVRVTLLFYLSAAWATLLEWIVFRKPIRLSRATAVFVGLSGAWVLLGGEHFIPNPQNSGEWFGLISGILFAVTLTIASAKINFDIFGQSFFAFITAATVGLLSFMMSLDRSFSTSISYESLIAVFSIAIFWLIPATLLLFWGARFLPPGQVALLMLLEIAAASISASILIAEPFGFREGFGCVTIIMSGLIGSWDSSPRPSSK